MYTQRFKIVGFVFALAVLVIALVTAAPVARAKNPNAAPAVAANWITTGNKITNSDFLGTNNNKPLVFKTNKVERLRIDTAGNVGVGTNAPGSKLTVAGVVESTGGGFKFPDGSTQTTAVTGGPNGWGLGGNAGTNPATNFVGTTDNQALVLKTNNTEQARIDTNGNIAIGTSTPAHHLTISGGPTWTSNYWAGALALSNASAVGWLSNISGNHFGLGQSNGGLYFFHSLSTPGTTASPAIYDMSITDAGNVGIGTTNPSAHLTVTSDTSNRPVIEANTPTGGILFQVFKNGNVTVGALSPYANTTHVCYNTSAGLLSQCNSAAEYVPTIDSGNGFPETADLVSIAPDIKNPYGDEHGPFVVQKSTLPCDTNLLGFIVKPESGADGVKKNDHYLPLAIYGYFPAKVSMENGFIHRGDALTSSSKAGYAMKATGACRIIGYALEDANTEGQIQVFANYGENTASEVAALRQENETLKQQLASIEARLAALEQTSPVAQNTVAQGH